MLFAGSGESGAGYFWQDCCFSTGPRHTSGTTTGNRNTPFSWLDSGWTNEMPNSTTTSDMLSNPKENIRMPCSISRKLWGNLFLEMLPLFVPLFSIQPSARTQILISWRWFWNFYCSSLGFCPVERKNLFLWWWWNTADADEEHSIQISCWIINTFPRAKYILAF